MNDASNFLEFEGQSGDNFIIPSIIQFLSLLNKSGELSFSLSNEAKALMYLYEGNFTHTELNKLGGIDVISHMFCWKYGTGKFEFTSNYQGDKILYKSLGMLNAQQILMRITQRIDECPFKEDLQEKFKSINSKVAMNKELIDESDRSDPIKSKIIEKLEKDECVSLSDLLTNVHPGEIPSCKAFHELLNKNLLINADNWEKELDPNTLLEVMNIVAKYTDQNIAIKFLTNHKESLGLTNEQTVNIKKLNSLNKEIKDEFTRLLPQGESRWQDLYKEINQYLDKLDKGL